MYDDNNVEYVEEDELIGDAGAQMLAFALPVSLSLAALMLGLVFGGLFGWLVRGHEVVEVPRELTLAEVGEVCEPQVEESIKEKQTELDEVKAYISVLKKDIADKTAELEEMRNKPVRKSSGPNKAMKKLQEELAQAKLQLQQAQDEKKQLIAALTETTNKLVKTEEKLEHQIVLTRVAEEDALVNKWHRFLNQASLDICEKGGRKKMGKCRETVGSLLARKKIQQRFNHCVNSKQATPMVAELAKDDSLPAYSYWLNKEDRIVKGWYLRLCDPTLPEASGFADEYETADAGF